MPSTEVYCTAAEIRAEMNLNSTSDDTKLTAIATAASRLIDGYMGYARDGFVAPETAVAREFTSLPRRHAWIDPCIAFTSIYTKESVTDTTYPTQLVIGTDVRGFQGDPKSQFVEYNQTPYHGILLMPNASRRVFVNGAYDNETGFPIHPDDAAGAVYQPTIQITARWGHSEAVPAPIKQATIMQSIRIYKRGAGGMADALLSSDFTQQRFMSMLDKDVKVLLNFSGLRRTNMGGR